jgi:glycosyltransferase 2 family protein
MQKSTRKWLFALLAAVLVAIIAYQARRFFGSGQFSGAKLWSAVRGADPALLILSVFAIYVCYALRALRWRVLQQNLGPSHFWQIYSLTLAGFASIFLLGRAGEPVRPILLARKEKLPTAGLFGIYLLERLLDTASTLVIAALGLILIRAREGATNSTSAFSTAFRTAGIALGGGLLIAIAFLVYLRLHGAPLLESRVDEWKRTHSWKARIGSVILDLARGVQTIRSWGDLALAALYSGLHWILVLFIYLWISHAFGGTLAQLTLGDAMLVMGVTLVGSVVQLPGVGGGSQVGAFVAYTAIFGVEKEAAAAASIVLWLITFAAVSLVGAPLLIHQGFSLGQLRELAGQENRG